MDGDKPARMRFWRWRSNPLRRHDDIVEAWLVPTVWAARPPVWRPHTPPTRHSHGSVPSGTPSEPSSSPMRPSAPHRSARRATGSCRQLQPAFAGGVDDGLGQYVRRILVE